MDRLPPGPTPSSSSAASDVYKRQAAAPRPAATNEDQTLLAKKETLELVRAYYRIRQPVLRQKVLELVQSMSVDDPDATGK